MLLANYGLSYQGYVTTCTFIPSVSWIHDVLILSLQRLASPQCRLMYRTVVTEIDQLTSRPSMKRKCHQILLLFIDQVIICKRRVGNKWSIEGPSLSWIPSPSALRLTVIHRNPNNFIVYYFEMMLYIS